MRICRNPSKSDPKWGKYGYGGENRTRQIEEFLVSNCNINDIVEVKFGYPSSKITKIKYALKLIFKHKFKMTFSKKIIMMSAQRYYDYIQFFNENKDIKTIFLEDPTTYIAYIAAKEAGIKVIVFIHNIETMVSTYEYDFFTKKRFPFSVVREIEFLRYADLIYCISREEQWLIKAFNINSVYLPYLPPSDKYEYFKGVRVKRLSINSIKPYKEFIIIGTIHYLPTLNSIHKQLDELDILSDKLNNIKVVLVGYGLEKFKIEYESKYSFLTVEGTVTPERLEELLMIVDAGLVYQDEGVGALTKIPELLLAGVPIIANFHAARSAHHYSGMYVYDTIEELYEYLYIDKVVPEIPEYKSVLMKKISDEIINLHVQ